MALRLDRNAVTTHHLLMNCYATRLACPRIICFMIFAESLLLAIRWMIYKPDRPPLFAIRDRFKQIDMIFEVLF